MVKGAVLVRGRESGRGSKQALSTGLPKLAGQCGTRSGSCSTEYVRGREAGEAVVPSNEILAECEVPSVLQLELFPVRV